MNDLTSLRLDGQVEETKRGQRDGDVENHDHGAVLFDHHLQALSAWQLTCASFGRRTTKNKLHAPALDRRPGQGVLMERGTAGARK